MPRSERADDERKERRRAIPTPLIVASEVAGRLLLLAGAVYVLAVVAARLRVIVVPVVLAMLLTAAFEPATERLRRGPIPAGLAAAIVLLAALLLLAALFALVTTALVGQLADLGSSLERGWKRAAGWVSELPFGLSPSEIEERVSGLFSANDGDRGLLSRVVSGAGTAIEVVAGFFFTIFFTFFFLKDGDRLSRLALSAFREDRRERMAEAGRRAGATLGSYLRGLFVLAAFNATLKAVALLLIGVPLVIPLTVLTFIGSFIPFVGAVTASLVSALVALSSGGLVPALLVIGAGIAIQQIEGNVLEPVVLSRAVKLHPTVVLAAVTSGAVVAGIAGAFLAVPLVASAASAASYLRASAASDR